MGSDILHTAEPIEISEMGATHKIWSGPTYNFAIVDSNALFTWGEGIN